MVIETEAVKFKLGVVYRPPPSSENGQTVAGFFADLTYVLDGYATSKNNCILLGDFNFHVDVSTDNSAQRFMSVLNEANLQQHVVGPTHVSEHTLDLVITPVSGCLVTVTSVSTMMSDHNWIHTISCNQKPAQPLKDVTVGKYKSIDREKTVRNQQNYQNYAPLMK